VDDNTSGNHGSIIFTCASDLIISPLDSTIGWPTTIELTGVHFVDGRSVKIVRVVYR
jgi:hypothetical protein